MMIPGAEIDDRAEDRNHVPDRRRLPTTAPTANVYSSLGITLRVSSGPPSDALSASCTRGVVLYGAIRTACHATGLFDDDAANIAVAKTQQNQRWSNIVEIDVGKQKIILGDGRLIDCQRRAQ
jgi:hypothetical protein